MIVDIHAHILPHVDDGAKNIEESLALLDMMKAQGITTVIATPHFYAAYDTAEDFENRITAAHHELLAATKGKKLPSIILGSEVLYYRYIGNSESIHKFCLNHADVLLLELSDNLIDDGLFEDLRLLIYDRHITPIIAHIERYHRAPYYKKLIRFVMENGLPAQINASSLFIRSEARIVQKLLKQEIVTYLATDTHSVDWRPPMMAAALKQIVEKFGQEQADTLIQNSLDLLRRIGGVNEK